MKITTLLFDLGSTLVFGKKSWPPIYEQADQSMIGSLINSGLKLDAKAFKAQLGGFINSYYKTPFIANQERTTFKALQEELARSGFQDVPEAVLRSALVALYSVTQKNWYLEKDAIPTLETLKKNGFQLGLVSNTSDDRNVQTIVDRLGIREYFKTIITSAGFGIRKPDRRIFQYALDQFQVEPSAAAMIGDTLEADIHGANQMGIYSIWITRRAQAQEEGELIYQPQAVVTTLSQIPALLAELNDEVPSEDL